ncbi:helix-turn-helix transcriptional regulator [Butyricicoccus faecihominis]|uniref:helix-turn-helix domain-containing protein n=2 Tax=Butyricicoccaceae TaxID=3085642 RepID=UPI0029588FB1|nr:helix-turn-helix transcriptional regulator [Agathobaculum sp. NTUH-O15-33]MCQ5131108.1 helix-turn-helix transcriptional regulator [Butyricicoccus faecihominis]WNX84124.1 helix-turn-helix transcriptional regulator [Agathobaculum sp. NTUH-O15-33]
MDYIEAFKKMRLEMKLSQVQLSEQLGLKSAAYGMYETRQRKMDVETFAKLCRILGTTPNEMLGFDE